MTRQLRQRKSDRLIQPGASSEEIRCDYAVAPLDHAATAMDEYWGIDRLPCLVSPATAEKYGKAMAHLLDCIDRRDAPACAAAAQNCIRGLAAMDAEAKAAGRQRADPDVWQVEIDGQRFGFVRDVTFANIAKARHPELIIFTLREAVVALRPAMFNIGVIDIKAHFPDAQVTANRTRTPTEQCLDDEIPF